MTDAPAVAATAIDALTTWTRVALDTVGVVILGAGTVAAVIAIPRAMRGARSFMQVRLDFARYLALALEFQLASDILETGISPSWTQLGQLATIAAIRTALNFFLAREMKDEWAFVNDRDGASPRGRAAQVGVGDSRGVAVT